MHMNITKNLKMCMFNNLPKNISENYKSKSDQWLAFEKFNKSKNPDQKKVLQIMKIIFENATSLLMLKNKT